MMRRQTLASVLAGLLPPANASSPSYAHACELAASFALSHVSRSADDTPFKHKHKLLKAALYKRREILSNGR